MNNLCASSPVWLALVACGLLITGDQLQGQQRLAPSVIQLAPEPKPTPEVKLATEVKPVPEIRPLPESRAVIYPHCYWKPLYQCVVAPYDCKPQPCPPLCGYDKSCDTYCGKPLPCPPAPCDKWCPGGYCPKPPVTCFPGNPCPPCVPAHR